MNTTVALEKSFADAQIAISTAVELPTDRRTHWACSLRAIARALDRPEAAIPARWTAIRPAVDRLHHATLGVTHKTLVNHKANARAALQWLAKEVGVPARGVDLTPEWAKLKAGIKDRRKGINLYALMRYFSGRSMAPLEVDEIGIDEFLSYRSATTACKSGSAARRRIARAWNACVGSVPGWPDRRLVEPPTRPVTEGPAWEEFPERLRGDVDRYLTSLAGVRRIAGGRRRRAPCAKSTIRVRRAMLVAFARKAVGCGIPIEELTSIAALLCPKRVERALEAYWPEESEKPPVYAIDLAALLVGVAKQTACLSESDLERVQDLGARLEAYRSRGLTEKNLAVVRRVSATGAWSRVVELPWGLMRQARALADRAPTKSAVLAQLAVAIGLLTIAPVRLGNLQQIKVEQNLTRPGGVGTAWWLTFPDYDVKNRIRLEFELSDKLTALIDEYLGSHHPVLLRGRSGDRFLFPGLAHGSKGGATLSSQITKCILRATGLRVTTHQFRHAAAALFLQHEPGNYERVRHILGHKNIQTTINFYIGLETTQAAREFRRIVESRMNFSAEI